MVTRNLKIFLLCALLVSFVSVDQWDKHTARAHTELLAQEPVLHQRFLLRTFMLNRGLGGNRFSQMPDGVIDPYIRYFPTLVWILLAALAFIVRVEPVAFTLVLAGGASNLLDHWRSYTVADTFLVYQGAGMYLPFNLADVAVCIGGAWLVASLSWRLRPLRRI